MNWMNDQIIEWRNPLDFTASLGERDIALLYSGMREGRQGRCSYLFVDPQRVAEGNDWAQLPEFKNTHSPLSSLPDWVGYIGYEMGDDVPQKSATLPFPRFRLVQYHELFQFDHETETLTHYVRDAARNRRSLRDKIVAFFTTHSHTTSHKQSLASNFTRDAYERCIAATVERIHAGDFYQANITRKFRGPFTTLANSFPVFKALTEASPAPYSAYIRHKNTAIISASPECFLTVGSDGTITTRPIKGSARRGHSEAEDAAIREALTQSAKNHAENLMIVDLMRNDLARVSIPESVRVTEQSGLYSYTTIHHLVSSITARKRADANVTDIVRACFPPGSMTGAPKIAAIRWCAEQERFARGIYSGALGWFAGDGSCDLSVVIRTLLIAGAECEFQVGGGIVADSTPEDEWRETLIKARGICAALGIEETALAAL
jgi:anthranilate/para-aminobenzoate synthase component I